MPTSPRLCDGAGVPWLRLWPRSTWPRLDDLPHTNLSVLQQSTAASHTTAPPHHPPPPPCLMAREALESRLLGLRAETPHLHGAHQWGTVCSATNPIISLTPHISHNIAGAVVTEPCSVTNCMLLVAEISCSPGELRKSLSLSKNPAPSCPAGEVNGAESPAAGTATPGQNQGRSRQAGPRGCAAQGQGASETKVGLGPERGPGTLTLA